MSIATQVGGAVFPKHQPLTKGYRNVLLFKIGAIGDVLMTTPLIRALRKHWPAATLTYATGTWSAPALEGNLYLDKVIPFDETDFFNRRADRVRAFYHAIRESRYDLCFVLDKTQYAGVICWRMKIPTRVGFDRDGEGYANTWNVAYGARRHETDYYLDLGTAVGAVPDGRHMEIFLQPSDYKELPRGYIVVCPGGADNPGQSMPGRRWPAERFGAVAAALNRPVVLLGGKKDMDAGRVVEEKVKAINLIGHTTLQESAAIMSKAALVLCNDSGPMHLAAAAGGNVLAVFGPTDPLRKAPVGSHWCWHEMENNEAEVYGKYTKAQNQNIKNVTVDEVVEMGRKIVE